MIADNGRHVFVVGSGRSGTTLLSNLLHDAGVFAVYRAETKLMDDCPPVYGSLSSEGAYRRFMADWLDSRQFRRSGLDQEEFEAAIAGCRDSYPHMLAAFMAAVARKQDRQQWIEDTPTCGFRLSEIAREFPQARVIHMVRDGRAVALSMNRLGVTGVRAEDNRTGLLYSALKWEIAVRAIERDRHLLGDRFCELRFEDMVTEPAAAIARLGDFLGLEFDADRIMQGQSNEQADAVANTAFGDVGSGISATPAHRWKDQLSAMEVRILNGYIGDTLEKLRYPVEERDTGLATRVVRHIRKLHLVGKRMLKQHTPLGRFAHTPLEIGKS